MRFFRDEFVLPEIKYFDKMTHLHDFTKTIKRIPSLASKELNRYRFEVLEIASHYIDSFQI